MITKEILLGLLIPFIGTSLGAFAVFFMKKRRADLGNAVLDINVEKHLPVLQLV